MSSRMEVSANERRNWWLWLLPLVVLLAGCIPQEEGDDHGYGSAYEGRTELGIRYRNDDDERPLTPEIIDLALTRAASCLGLAVRQNYDLFVVSDDEIEEYDEWDAFFSTNPPMIVIEPHEYESVTLDLLEHEMVHFLSWLELDGIDANHKLQCYPHGTIAG